MAGQEWRTAADEFGHTPRRSELGLGFPTSARWATDRPREDTADPGPTEPPDPGAG